MHDRARTATTAHRPSQHEVNIFRTALRLIGQGFVEIAQGIGLIAEGTLRPVRSLVPSFVALAAIVAFTTTILVLVVTAVAQTDATLYRDDGAWTRWNSSPELHFGDNTVSPTDLEHLAETEAEAQETVDPAYAALWLSD